MEHLIKKLTVERVIPLTADAKRFELSFSPGEEPAYEAGQFLTLVFKTPFGEKRRSYSLCSAPVLGETLSIAVKIVENGEFSRKLFYQLKEGDELETSGIGGFFVLPKKPAEKTYFFLAAGSGITPCFSLIKTILHTTGANVLLLYSNRSEVSCIFHQELLALQQQYATRFTIRFFFSNRFNILEKRLSAWLLDQILDKHQPADKKSALFYICGPFDYQLMASIAIRVKGYDSTQIMKEQFSYLPRTFIPTPPNTQEQIVTIEFEGQQKRLKVQYPTSILAAAKAQGLPVPYSCEAGRCGSCVATCTHGKIWMAYNEVLMPDEVEKGRILTCQAYPLSAATVVF